MSLKQNHSEDLACCYQFQPSLCPPSTLLTVADYRKWKCTTFKHVIAQYVTNDMTNEEEKGALNQVPPRQRIPFSGWACCLSLKRSLSLKWTVWAWCLHIWLPEGSVEGSCATRPFLLIQTKFMVWTDVAFSRLTVPNGPWTQQKCSSGEFELLHRRVVEKHQYILTQMLTCSLIKYLLKLPTALFPQVWWLIRG